MGFRIACQPAYESVCRGVCGEGSNSPPQQKVSQKRVVSGDVTTPDGKPVPGATVSVKNRPIWAAFSPTTKGHFQLSVPDNSILIVSFLGYNTEEISVGQSSLPLRIVLTDSATKIDDVVVVGYGVQRKESVVGAISQVDNKSLVNSGTANITNALTGKLSGVTSIQSSGQPGENDATLLIRGVSSWNGSAPLSSWTAWSVISPIWTRTRSRRSRC